MNFCAPVQKNKKNYIKLFNCASNIQNVWTENVENNQFLFFQKLKFMEPSRVWYQVTPPGPFQQFLCPSRKSTHALERLRWPLAAAVFSSVVLSTDVVCHYH